MPVGIYKRTEKQKNRLREISKKPRVFRNGGYDAIHKWLNRHYGKANKCQNLFCNHTSNLFQYALLHDFKHAHDRKRYIMLCSKCHFNYDINEEKRARQAEKMRGRKMPKKVKDKISKSMKGKNIGNKNACK